MPGTRILYQRYPSRGTGYSEWSDSGSAARTTMDSPSPTVCMNSPARPGPARRRTPWPSVLATVTLALIGSRIGVGVGVGPGVLVGGSGVGASAATCCTVGSLGAATVLSGVPSNRVTPSQTSPAISARAIPPSTQTGPVLPNLRVGGGTAATWAAGVSSKKLYSVSRRGSSTVSESGAMFTQLASAASVDWYS